MAESAITAIAKSALQLFCPLAKDEFLLLWKSGKELKRLENTIETISYLLYDTDKLQSEEKSVQNCLSRLRDVMYDAEEFFDALRWRVLHEKTMAESERVVFSKKGRLPQIDQTSVPVSRDENFPARHFIAS